MPKAATKNNRRRHARPAKSTAADPILAAIANHKKLDRAWLEVAGAKGDRDAHARRGSDAAERAAWQMARTKPTTVAGAAALLKYITRGPITGLFELGETDWHETAFRNAAASLAEIARRSKRAA